MLDLVIERSGRKAALGIEVLACSFLGIEPGFAATLLVISTLVDIPATLLNTSDNIVAAAWVDRLCKRKEEEKPV